MERLTIRFFLFLLACIFSAPAVFAQRGKLVKELGQGFGRVSVEGVVKTGARKLPGATAAQAVRAGNYPTGKGVQLQLQFPGEPVQLSIAFPEENAIAPQAAAQLDALAQAMHKIMQAPSLTLPSGETVRVVKLEAKHFKKTHKLNSTIGHYASQDKNPVVLQNAKGQRVTVYQNDRLRYFSDLGRVCPAGSYLLRHEDGRTEMRTPEEASESLKRSYEETRARRESSSGIISFMVPSGPVSAPRLESVGVLFTQKPFETAVYVLPAHPLKAEPVQVAVLRRTVQIPGLADLAWGSMVVRYPDGTFDVHPADRVPPVLKEKVEAVQKKGSSSNVVFHVEENGTFTPQYKPSAENTYDSQSRLGQDLHRAGGKSRRYASSLFGDVIAYEIPGGIYYKPDGAAGKMLDPQTQVVLYIPAQDRGVLVPRAMLNNAELFTPAQ